MSDSEERPPVRGDVQAYGWSWGTDWNREGERRGNVPWIGIFLVVFGLILLVDRLPGARLAFSAFILAAGLAMLVAWLIKRRVWWLYAGAIVTALALPGVLQEGGVIRGDGWGTLFLGLAFLGIALVRAASGAGTGWQLLVGSILTAIGALRVAEPSVAGLFWPAILVVGGGVLVARGLSR
jgi:hypothetical protein